LEKKSGRKAVVDFLNDTGSMIERLGLEVQDVLAGQDRAVIIGSLSSRVKQTGKVINTDFGIILTVTGGEISRFQMLEDSFAVSRAARPPSLHGRLNQKVAVVTGGSRGIGSGIARRLAREGASVIVTYPHDADAPSETLRAIAEAGGRAWSVKADSSDPGAVDAAVNQVVHDHGHLDILVNNAGILVVQHIDKFSYEDFDKMLSINIRGAFAASRAAARHMGQGGRIIMIGSCNADRMPFEGGSVYSLIKAAIAGFTKGLARDLGPRGITVNNVQPGPTNTDLNPSTGPYAQTFLDMLALDRFAHVDEIAGMVAYLASDEASFVTGSSLTIDGGFNA
jgi:3-oxoacyl-[acyl-carrier protein] reductase